MKTTIILYFVFLLLFPIVVCGAENGETQIDSLIKELKTKPDLKVKKIKTLPQEIQGPIDIVGEFDEENKNWVHFTNSENYGEINPTSLVFLGYQFGNDGFVQTDYSRITDRRVVTYTGINNEKNIVLSIMDDASFKDSLVLNINIGPQKIRYLMRRLH
jgi:hypothetical protein